MSVSVSQDLAPETLVYNLNPVTPSKSTDISVQTHINAEVLGKRKPDVQHESHYSQGVRSSTQHLPA